MTHSITFFPLGNADCARITLQNGRRILIDYANTRPSDAQDDPRCDLPTLLRDDLEDAGRDGFDVVAFTHLDRDHYGGFSEFFYLEHATKYQSTGRPKIATLWVPAAVLTESRPDADEACVLQAEARHRFRERTGIRVFSWPDRLEDWCKRNKIDYEQRKHLVVDAGKLVPGFTLEKDELEFFVHSPHARRLNKREVEDRNDDCLVLQATFSVKGELTRALLLSDAPYELLRDVVQITRDLKDRPHRLHWDILKVPHHCSYLSVGPEKGKDQTEPDADVDWLYQKAQASSVPYIVSTSKPIPTNGSKEDKDDQPPHRQAANYYRSVVPADHFLVTMEHRSQAEPEPIVFDIDRFGPTLRKQRADAPPSVTAPRAG